VKKVVIAFMLALVVIAAVIIVCAFAVPACTHIKTSKISEPLVQEVVEYLDATNWDRITEIPIYERGDIRTAMALTEKEVERCQVAVLVSPNWQSFSPNFKRYLLAHEFLHILEAEKGVAVEQFSEEVRMWYRDTTWGTPTPDGNYTKYILFWNVYGGNGEQVQLEYREREEFAYIGGELIHQRKSEVPFIIRSYYFGILQISLIEKGND